MIILRIVKTSPPNISPPDKEDLGGLRYIPYKVNLKVLARVNRKNPTKAERKMWNEVLRNKQFNGFKFHRQKPLNRYIADFYCPELMLVIEVDGDSHYEEDAKEYDLERTINLEQSKIKVIRYNNLDVLSNIEGVWESLSEEIEKRKKELNL
jgi:very-short-patch-repair endonuclease